MVHVLIQCMGEDQNVVYIERRKLGFFRVESHWHSLHEFLEHCLGIGKAEKHDLELK